MSDDNDMSSGDYRLFTLLFGAGAGAVIAGLLIIVIYLHFEHQEDRILQCIEATHDARACHHVFDGRTDTGP